MATTTTFRVQAVKTAAPKPGAVLHKHQDPEADINEDEEDLNVLARMDSIDDFIHEDDHSDSSPESMDESHDIRHHNSEMSATLQRCLSYLDDPEEDKPRRRSSSEEADSASSQLLTPPSHLDMEEQRQQVQWHKSEAHQAFQAHYAQLAAIKQEDRIVATKLLLNEAHRMHRLAKARGIQHTTDAEWKRIAGAIDEEFATGSVTLAQRSVSCMCVFSPSSSAREYGEHEGDRHRRHMSQQNVILELSLQGRHDRSDPAAMHFLRPDGQGFREYMEKHRKNALVTTPVLAAPGKKATKK